MFIIAIALLTVLLVGILMFTDIVDEEGNLDRQRLRAGAAQLARFPRSIRQIPRPRG